MDEMPLQSSREIIWISRTKGQIPSTDEDNVIYDQKLPTSYDHEDRLLCQCFIYGSEAHKKRSNTDRIRVFGLQWMATSVIVTPVKCQWMCWGNSFKVLILGSRMYFSLNQGRCSTETHCWCISTFSAWRHAGFLHHIQTGLGEYLEII